MSATKFEDNAAEPIRSYTFKKLLEDDNKIVNNQVVNFEIEELSEHRQRVKKEIAPKISLEKILSKSGFFKLSPIVGEHRGITELEKQEFENKVESEVQRRLELLKADALKEGLSKGRDEAFQQVLAEMEQDSQEKSAAFAAFIESMRGHKKTILMSHAKDIIGIVKSLTRWILLRELKSDDQFLERLLQKLILEIGEKDNLLIRIGQSDAQKIKHAISTVEQQLGELRNLRIEHSEDINSGIYLESVHGAIDATMETQVQFLDQLFNDLDDQKISIKNDNE